MKKTLTTCPYCGTGCMFYLVSDGGRLVGVEPSTTHPISRGSLCVKGWNAYAFVHHPDRLTTPLVRRGADLQPASWDEALGLVVDRLRAIQREHGADALMFASSAKATNEENYLLMKLARGVFGTNNIDHCARLCHSSTVTGLAETFGSGAMTNSISCFDRTDLIFVIGSNTTEQHPLIGSRIITAVRRGARLIVADNRRIRLARHAQLHLRHKNGSDVALLNGMMHVIIAEGLADRAFIDDRTENYMALAAAVADWTPERAAALTGLTADEIVASARLFAGAERAMIVYSMGITQHSHGVDNVRCCAALALLTGNVGRPGTGVNPLRGQNNVQGGCDMGALPDVVSGYQNVADPAVREKFARAWGVPELPAVPGLPLTRAMDAAADGGLRGMFIMGENPHAVRPRPGPRPAGAGEPGLPGGAGYFSDGDGAAGRRGAAGRLLCRKGWDLHQYRAPGAAGAQGGGASRRSPGRLGDHLCAGGACRLPGDGLPRPRDGDGRNCRSYSALRRYILRPARPSRSAMALSGTGSPRHPGAAHRTVSPAALVASVRLSSVPPQKQPMATTPSC